ncbi:hypothetical protein AVEN_265814-1 [Araneus ventricosus]|uniref:Uncharacterized protein n=1 Tax=Araneus ventricosus TaxID=182803 RepID=A0A4Y2DZL6_ARAVE|nr:hypothetical protein AVEN_265814-1 [Araneus ventricosus]
MKFDHQKYIFCNASFSLTVVLLQALSTANASIRTSDVGWVNTQWILRFELRKEIRTSRFLFHRKIASRLRYEPTANDGKGRNPPRTINHRLSVVNEEKRGSLEYVSVYRFDLAGPMEDLVRFEPETPSTPASQLQSNGSRIVRFANVNTPEHLSIDRRYCEDSRTAVKIGLVATWTVGNLHKGVFAQRAVFHSISSDTWHTKPFRNFQLRRSDGCPFSAELRRDYP